MVSDWSSFLARFSTTFFANLNPVTAKRAESGAGSARIGGAGWAMREARVYAMEAGSTLAVHIVSDKQ